MAHPKEFAEGLSIGIIMDGNGRWAKKRFLPRVAGHQRGLEAVRRTVRACVDLGVEYLTLFAFSSENWRRPADEVEFLMKLFVKALHKEVKRLHDNGVRLRIIGDTQALPSELQQLIEKEIHARETRPDLSIQTSKPAKVLRPPAYPEHHPEDY